MTSFMHRMARLLLTLFAIIGGAPVMGCGPTTVTTGTFTEVNRLESNLKRGVSTKSDVQHVLGAPTGSGSAIFPTDPMPREVWFYQDIELTDAKPEGNEAIRVNMRQQILLVFFKKEVFDGFMWYSNVVPGTGKRQ
jgi:outer membrane protein assembly factor BamE (lipoprotein component of BamABCDE complex)